VVEEPTEQHMGRTATVDLRGDHLGAGSADGGVANADWEDQIGSNDGTVSGTPNSATSTDGGETWFDVT
jgi:hypothetical protein